MVSDSILIQRFVIKMCQFDLVNTTESILPVCDYPYHTNKKERTKGEEIEVLRNCAYPLISTFTF